jgi:hypothetical protein
MDAEAGLPLLAIDALISGVQRAVLRHRGRRAHSAGTTGPPPRSPRPGSGTRRTPTREETRDETAPDQALKTAARTAIENRGYTIVANIGNSVSDLAGGHAERTFKLPDYDGQLA